MNCTPLTQALSQIFTVNFLYLWLCRHPIKKLAHAQITNSLQTIYRMVTGGRFCLAYSGIFLALATVGFLPSNRIAASTTAPPCSYVIGGVSDQPPDTSILPGQVARTHLFIGGDSPGCVEIN